MSTTENHFSNNEQWQRFEYIVDNQRSFIEYTIEGKNYLLMHAEVPADLEGHGVAKEMVEKTFSYLEQNGFTMSPYCPYIFSYLKRHLAWRRIELPANLPTR